MLDKYRPLGPKVFVGLATFAGILAIYLAGTLIYYQAKQHFNPTTYQPQTMQVAALPEATSYYLTYQSLDNLLQA